MIAGPSRGSVASTGPLEDSIERPLLALVLLASLVACRAESRPGNRASAQDSALVDAPVTGADDPRWTVTARGIGPLHAGMSLDEARTAAAGTLPDTSTTESCLYIPLVGAPGSVHAMLVDGRLARIDVRDSSVATDRGARVGDAEARIAALYGDRVSVQPHKYTDGHYLIVTPAVAADSAYRLVFETDGSRVIAYRAGVLPAVEWVEGCG